ncbi:hypothetical protein K505DRAFT_252231 [Melanomma pulvis-pyrius CBS 109.77]|uniref:LIM zinc-binding domain-containing protein n=1 Tax=Melanomma pulvis-pyrius CBS 109.77 TaxID=1314802 RepID=A0A6A6X1B4_9PLEO|nr:hypothetical protein K505DRAFT_252231 [Melanomma pulvis-pyrius CBS 109.77]
MHKPKEREGAASPAPVFMSSAQMTNYLQDLRSNRPARPTGSRPPPAHFNTWSSRASAKFVDSPVVSPFSHPTFKEAGVDVDTLPQPTITPAPVPESKSHRRTTSNMSIDEILAAGAGRPLVQPPRGRNMSTSSMARERTPSVTYRENGQRQVEREEAMAVRIAMEELALKEEQGLYTAARDEAAELVWKHRNPNAPGASPDAPYPYPAGEIGSSQRSRSQGRGEQELKRSRSKLKKRNSMGSSAGGSRSSSLQSRRAASGSSVTANADFGPSPTKENFEHGVGSYFPAAPQRTSSNPSDAKNQRRSSSARRKASGSLFKNPDDQIYEEPEEEAPPPAVVNPPPPAKLPLGVRRNPFSRLQFTKDNNLVRSQTDPTIGTKRFDRYEIHNNPVTRSRDAAYTLNPAVPKPKEEKTPEIENEPEVKMKDGKEIRGDDIRAATRFRLKDRSAKLPTPTLVSDSPGRPIVSFRNDWKPKEVELKEEISSFPQSAPRPVAQDALPRPLSKAQTAPVVPTIHVQDEPPKRTMATSPAPSTRVSRAQIPAISVYEDPPARPLPNASTSRKVNTPTQSAAPPVPTINVYQAPPTRTQSTPAPPIPTISVQETPSISVSAPDRGRPSMKGPAISVTPSVPSISVNEPSAPTRAPKINAPSISVSPSVPSINVNGPAPSTRPLPNPRHHTSPFPRTNTANSRSHWTPAAVRTGILCAQCALPISGRIVSAAGSRFHPECFQCHHCGEHLECVAFYPEPDNKHAERVSRIQARLRGEDIEFLSTHPTAEDMMRLEQEDGDEAKRFYCHLDFHEFFSPRCKSCKTPIEGEVVVACGAEWHVGHFFCAQCGDPFDSSTPFVEKEGYAWCVNCHTNRFSTKCKKCRKPVTDTVVKALGAEWHMACFCCMECSGPFEDGRYFLRGDSMDPVCVRCEERRLKA